MTIYRGPGGTGSASSDSDTTQFQEFLVQSQAARDAAQAAQAAAELAETHAETAETNAEAAEVNAETAETNAAGSATSASSSATAAATSATNAASSATAAASSATAAAASAASINDADLVHKTGNETIGGVKTFTSSIAGSVTGTATNVTGTVAVANGGTGATTASAARTALGVAVGTDVLPVANPSYTGTLTGGTGVVNLGSGQFYKDASGNVGIGTSLPAAPLDVTTNSSASGIAVRGRSDNISNIALQSNNGATNYGQIQGRSTDLRIQGVSLPVTFYGASSEWGRFDTSGNLLVGTTSYAGIGLSLGKPDSSGCFSFFAGSGSGYHWRFGAANTGPVGSITTSGSTTTFSTSSDYRLKENVQPMTGALARISTLKPVTYKWKADGSDGEGFIAHELQAVVPDAVVGEKDAVETYTDEYGNEQTRPIHQGIDSSFLVATLTAAIQEQQAMIDQLKADVAALKAAA